MQQLAAQIPWFHHCVLLEKVEDPHERSWYIEQTIEHGWSRSILEVQIETNVFQRKGKAFTTALPDALKAQLPTIADLEAQLKDVEAGETSDE